MSQQTHKGQILPLKNRVIPVDSDTVFLAHYDLNENDVLSGIKPDGSRYALKFNGSSTYVPVKLTLTSSYTKEAWVYYTGGAASGGQNIISSQSTGHALWVDTGVLKSMHNVGGMQTVADTQNLVNNAWVHVAATYDSGTTTMTLYVNGVQVGQSTAIPALPEASIQFGRYNTTSYFSGSISDVRIWNYARSAQQIKDGMNSALTGAEIGLVGYWRMNEDQGAVACDIVSGNDGVIYNGIWSDGRAIFTLRPNGYFGGGVAVEESTTNLASSISYGVYTRMNHNGSFAIWNPDRAPLVEQYTVSAVDLVPRGDKILPASAGITYAASFVVKITGSGTLFYDAGKSYPESGNTISLTGVSKTETPLGNGWTKVDYIYTVSSNTATQCIFQFGIAGSAAVGDILYIYNLQLEEKSFTTSFVDGSRPDPYLAYPASLIEGQAEGTIAFWYKPSYLLAGYQILMRTGNWASGDQGWGIVKQSGSNKVYFEYGIPGTNTVTVTSLNEVLVVDQWTFIAITWSPTGVSIFTSDSSGNLSKASAGGSPPILSSYIYPITLGRDTASPQMIANGIYDELRIDSIARTDDEIYAWYYSNSPFWPRGIYKASY